MVAASPVTIRSRFNAALDDALLCDVWLCGACRNGCPRGRPDGGSAQCTTRRATIAAGPSPPTLQGPNDHRLSRAAARARRADLFPDHAAPAGLLDPARLLWPRLRLQLPGRLLRRRRLSPLFLPRALCVRGDGVLLRVAFVPRRELRSLCFQAAD